MYSIDYIYKTIHLYYNENKSFNKIGKILNVSRQIISIWINNFKNDILFLSNQPQSGGSAHWARRNKLKNIKLNKNISNIEIILYIKNLIYNNPFITRKEIIEYIYIKFKIKLTLNNISKIYKNLNMTRKKTKLNICYVRVSSSSQKDDLERQKDLMKAKYKDYTVIEDIGSGLNLNKRGINKIIHLAIKGKINEVVVAYKDRLTRFGFELIEDIIQKYSNGKITILNKRQTTDPHEELVKDVMAIMNIYVAKMNGLRRYKNKDKPKESNVNIEINDK